MRFEQLPRDDNGIVPGLWKLRHVSPTFNERLGSTTFVNGETVSPMQGPEICMVMAALIGDVEAEPWEEPTADEPAVAPSTPTTWADLEAMAEDQLRACAAELGATDKRWKAPRLRRFIADELGIELPEDTDA